MLAGELVLRHGDQEAALSPGDAVYFDAGMPHSYRCSGSKPAEAIIVTMHQASAGQPQPLRPSVAPAARPASAAPVRAIRSFESLLLILYERSTDVAHLYRT